VSVEKGGELFLIADGWRAAYPGASAGVLAMRGLANPARHPALEKRRIEVEDSLRARFGAMDRTQMTATSPLSAYSTYFKRFKKTYPVQLQLESVVARGKHIPSFSSLVTAMFTAELKNQLLTAGHDLDALELPVRLDVADGSESCLLLSGTEQQLKSGDMYMADGVGVVSVVVYGPDQRTRITLETSRALFAVYAPPGVDSDSVRSHLEDIRDNVLLFSPSAAVEHLEVYSA
jgi:DNA/RNA-binding domain of Phe-tRNA-synthetase-like protein